MREQVTGRGECVRICTLPQNLEFRIQNSKLSYPLSFTFYTSIPEVFHGSEVNVLQIWHKTCLNFPLGANLVSSF
jgi:hypothetical protein